LGTAEIFCRAPKERNARVIYIGQCEAVAVRARKIRMMKRVAAFGSAWVLLVSLVIVLARVAAPVGDGAVTVLAPGRPAQAPGL